MTRIIDSLNTPGKMKTFISNLDNNIFKSLKDPKDVDCNLLLVKVKNKFGTYLCIKKPDGSILIPNEADLKKLNNTLFTAENSLCLFKVNKGYIKEQNKNSDISLVLFSVNANDRSNNTRITICGLLFLIEKINKTLYIPLICCKSGIGGVFMKLEEKIARDYKYHKITLNSMARPLGFYIYKGYNFAKGNDVYKIEKDFPLFLDKYDEKLGKIKRVGSKNASKRAGFLNKSGKLIPYSTYSASLSRNVPGQLKRAQRNFLTTGVNSLQGVRMLGNEIGMEKNTRTDARTSAQPMRRRQPALPKQRSAGKYRTRTRRRGNLGYTSYMGGKRTNIRRTNKSKRKSKRKVKR